MKNIGIIILMLILFFVLFYFWWRISEPWIVSAITERPTPAMEHKLNAACQFHGPLIVPYRTIDGQWYFERDGKTCKLFTEGFLESYHRNHLTVLSARLRPRL